MALIQLKDIAKVFKKQQHTVHALRSITLEVNSGELVAIWGPSGSGKSTLLNILGALDFPDNGDYHFNGVSIRKHSDLEISRFRASNIGFIFQSYNLLPHLRAWENVVLPARYTGVRFNKAEARTRALQLLEQVGLRERSEHLPSELSGGEEQRVAIARALMNDPQVILADEPTGNLDTKNHQAILGILRELHSQGKTILVVSHNPEVVEMAQRVVRLRDGSLEGCQ
jgi:putative ABC transport system ATP-binding protein